ncbi:MAG: hypothetical protein NXI21_05885 [Alphaproteobacteria bacterium]|nr:hypothetical protein [Alphaproteobacteria bacterium]
MHDRWVMFCSSGWMTQGAPTGLGPALRAKLEIDQVDRKTVKRVFSVLVDL